MIYNIEYIVDNREYIEYSKKREKKKKKIRVGYSYTWSGKRAISEPAKYTNTNDDS